MGLAFGGKKNLKFTYLRCKNKNLERIMICISLIAVLLEVMVKSHSSCFIEEFIKT